MVVPKLCHLPLAYRLCGDWRRGRSLRHFDGKVLASVRAYATEGSAFPRDPSERFPESNRQHDIVGRSSASVVSPIARACCVHGAKTIWHCPNRVVNAPDTNLERRHYSACSLCSVPSKRSWRGLPSTMVCRQIGRCHTRWSDAMVARLWSRCRSTPSWRWRSSSSPRLS